jgi:hypothetical protein
MQVTLSYRRYIALWTKVAENLTRGWQFLGEGCRGVLNASLGRFSFAQARELPQFEFEMA